MTVHLHCSTASTPFARGRELGECWRPQIEQTVSDYDWLFESAGLPPSIVREVAESCHDAIRAWAPDLAQETEGIADGAGLAVWQAAALTARTEIAVRGRIAGMSECTSGAWLPPTGPPHALQTWDWIPRVNDFTVRRHRSSEHLDVATFAEHGALGKLGVNSAGFGVLMALMCHSSDGSQAGVPVHAVARRLLDTARTVTDAVEIATSAPLAASTALTLLEYDGERTMGVVLELAPSGCATRIPRDGFLLHTNHFLDPELAAGDRLAAVKDDTLPRLERLEELRDALREDEHSAMAHGLVSHWADGAPICAHPRMAAPETNRWETKVTFGLDLASQTLGFHEGGPCRVTRNGWREVAA